MAVGRSPQADAHGFGKRALRLSKDKARQILESWVVETLDVVKQTMVEPLADGFEGRLDLAEIPQPTRPRIGLTAKCNLRIERMAMQARIFRSALPQPVRCVEDKFLREFDHVRRVAGVFGAVKR